MLEPLVSWRSLAVHGSIGLNVAIGVFEDPAFRLFEKAVRVLSGQVLVVGQTALSLRRNDVPAGRRILEMETDPPGLAPELQSSRAR